MPEELANAGKVYIFNATPYQVTMVLNNKAIMSPLNGIKVENEYKAEVKPVKRNPADHSGTNEFGTYNTLAVSYDDGNPVPFPVTIYQSDHPIGQDLQLYLFEDQVTLVSKDGKTEIFRPVPQLAAVGV
ncbi:hypothetical protein RKE29_04500 [Streptomyces sp. B1866]|uniref:hypothetical protein n=1 Tax=Streptomyces sp. B1866 TaxID=3075431 RepID=UPI0028909ED9|nr:hypothetical protein [Streptomyces sp. B1866]MDT3395910.1 hypothetical protein [Streptomyces sp. B1866]